MKQIVSDGRRAVGTVALDPATGQWAGAVHVPFPWWRPCSTLSRTAASITKAAAIEAILRASGEFSIWDM